MREEIEALEDHADMVADPTQMVFRSPKRAFAARFMIGKVGERQLALLELNSSSTVRMPKRLLTLENSMMGGLLLSVIARVFLLSEELAAGGGGRPSR